MRKKVLIVGVPVVACFAIATALTVLTRYHRDTQAVSSALNKPNVQPKYNDQVVDWNRQYGGVTTTLVEDVSTISDDINPSSSSPLPSGLSLSADCQKLSSDVASASSVPKIPDAEAETVFSSALVSLRKTAQECNSTDTQTTASDAQEANSHLADLVQRMLWITPLINN